MYRTWIERREIKSILASSSGSLGNNQYTRLFMLSAIDMAITIPFNTWYFTTWIQTTLVSWPGWKALHRNFSQISVVTTAEVRSDSRLYSQTEITRWMYVAYGFIFFGLFGVTAEARKHYASAWLYVLQIFSWKTGFSRESFRYVLLGCVLFQCAYH
jgi:pheromone a factor receptor